MPKFMLDGKEYGGGSDSSIEITQAKYDELVQSNSIQKDVTYYITDSKDEFDASFVKYDNTESGLEATNVQSAINEVNSNLTAPLPSYVTISTENKSTINSVSYTVDIPTDAVRVNIKKTSVSNYTTAVITIGDESINLSTGSDSKTYIVDCTDVDSISVVVTDQYNNNPMVLEFEFQKKEFNDVQFKFGIDGDGNYGYYKADGSFVPFKKIPEGYSPAKQLSGSFSQTINGGGSSWTGETDVTITFDPPFNTTPVNVDVWETSMTTKYFRNNQVYCVPMQIEPDHCVVRIYSNIQWTSINDFKWEAIAFYE